MSPLSFSLQALEETELNEPSGLRTWVWSTVHVRCGLRVLTATQHRSAMIGLILPICTKKTSDSFPGFVCNASFL